MCNLNLAAMPGSDSTWPKHRSTATGTPAAFVVVTRGPGIDFYAIR